MRIDIGQPVCNGNFGAPTGSVSHSIPLFLPAPAVVVALFCMVTHICSHQCFVSLRWPPKAVSAAFLWPPASQSAIVRGWGSMMMRIQRFLIPPSGLLHLVLRHRCIPFSSLRSNYSNFNTLLWYRVAELISPVFLGDANIRIASVNACLQQ